jgi:hypothetical protein
MLPPYAYEKAPPCTTGQPLFDLRRLKDATSLVFNVFSSSAPPLMS